MNTTPNSNRIHISLFGKTNSGKSSIMNKILNQDCSLVSDIKGTTTDPVTKAMELIPIGPVLFIDTAGLDDDTVLGELRIKKTLNVILKTDLALYVLDANDLDLKHFNSTVLKFKKHNIPYLTIINKIDTIDTITIQKIKNDFKDAIFTSCNISSTIDSLKNNIIKFLENKSLEDESLIGNLLPYDSSVVLVVPIDSEAPKGRLILPQVQLIRDCLDHGIKSYVVRDTELSSALLDIKCVDLVITDSQAFKKVEKILPKNINLTSFSILLANQKGDLKVFLEGVYSINKLKENSKILICESCTHNKSHEDIGTVKIPNLLRKFVGSNLNFDFCMGQDFPSNISKYDLVIHCGGCMVNKKYMNSRINHCINNHVPITNYGIVLAYLTGILDRSIKIFKNKI